MDTRHLTDDEALKVIEVIENHELSSDQETRLKKSVNSYKNNTFSCVIDKRSRKWEMFYDHSYYGLYCVRLKEDKQFNSQTSFHFESRNMAIDFLELLSHSS